MGVRERRVQSRHWGAADARRRVRLRRTLLAVSLTAVLVVVTVVAGSVLNLRQNLTVQPLRADDQEASSAVSTGALDILLLGSDARATEQDGGAEPARSDAMLIVHIAADDSRIDALQIPRDTVLDLPPCDDVGHGAAPGGHGMINAALNYGPACSVAAVESLTGVRIDHFLEMDFAGFAAIVDALDGLPVCLPEALEDSKADLHLPAGEQVLGGDDALALARTRHAVGDGSDISRLDHQQMVLSALADRAGELNVLTRPDRLYPFLSAVTSATTVDPELGSMSTLTALASRVGGIPESSLTVRTMPWAAAPEDPNRVVPGEEADQMFRNLSHDRPLTAQDGADPATKDESEQEQEQEPASESAENADPSSEPSVKVPRAGPQDEQSRSSSTTDTCS